MNDEAVSMNHIDFAIEDPRSPEVAPLLEAHLGFSRDVTPLCEVHALDVDGLSDPAVTLFAGRRDGEVVAVGAIRHLTDRHCELKSMHVRADVRGGGVGQALLAHLLSAVRSQGYERVSLETGTMDALAAARRLYERAGFSPCAPFGEYADHPHGICMTLPLSGSGRG